MTESNTFKPADKIEHLICLNSTQIEQLELSMADVVELLDTMFRQRAVTRMVNPPKIFEHRSDTRLYSSMVSFAPSMGFASCKWQSGDADNPSRGLPLIQGLLLLTEDETGQPVALMDAKWITGERTAAASALLARHQARDGAQTLSILGCGLQARKHLLAMTQAVPTLQRCVVYDIIGERAAKYVAEMSEHYELEIVATSSPKECVVEGDIVVSGAPIVAHPEPVIEPDWVKPGCLGISIDYDASWRPDTVASMDLVLSDDRAQLKDEQNKGHFKGVDRLDADLSEMLHTGQALRSNNEQRILGYNLGIALEDLAVACELYRRALAQNVGTLVAM
jgi:ornithine cyclodeaminase/alanine dehydrogenase-like protein (mu-crystallin family)